MMNNEIYIEDENSEPKKIGGIEVDQSEIKRAKRCKLFLDCINISCSYFDSCGIAKDIIRKPSVYIRKGHFT